jgi:hypothetical protein
MTASHVHSVGVVCCKESSHGFGKGVGASCAGAGRVGLGAPKEGMQAVLVLSDRAAGHACCAWRCAYWEGGLGALSECNSHFDEPFGGRLRAARAENCIALQYS